MSAHRQHFNLKQPVFWGRPGSSSSAPHASEPEHINTHAHTPPQICVNVRPAWMDYDEITVSVNTGGFTGPLWPVCVLAINTPESYNGS